MASLEFVTKLAEDPTPLQVVDVTTGQAWTRVYNGVDGWASQNPGHGSQRFSPFPGYDASAPWTVPTMYLARTLDAALMETVFHTVTAGSSRTGIRPVVTAHKVLGQLHAQLLLPRDMRLLDLRDPALSSLGIPRSGIVSSSALHYPCTRRIAERIHRHPLEVDGIIWHSRQAELARARAAGGLVITGSGPTTPDPGEDDEVMVLFGTRVGAGRLGPWTLAATPDSNGSLFEGAGRAAANRVATAVGVTIDWDFTGR